jgi:hypothetical protein
MTDNTDDFETRKEEALSRLNDFINFAYDDRFAALFTEAEDEDLEELASTIVELSGRLSKRSDYPDFGDSDDNDSDEDED